MSWGLWILGALVGLAILGFITEDKDSRAKRKAESAKRKAKKKAEHAKKKAEHAKRIAERDRKKADKKLVPIKFEEARNKHLKKKPKRTSTHAYEIWKDNDSSWRELERLMVKMPKHQKNAVKEMALVNLDLAKRTAGIMRGQKIKKKTPSL